LNRRQIFGKKKEGGGEECSAPKEVVR
jgi:hypothetical protein